MAVIFWLSFIAVVYVYLGYPMLLACVRRFVRRPVTKAAIEPAVTILIAAHNERERIERKIRNCFELDYPRAKLQIVVALDGPTDGTEFIVWRYAAKGVQLVHQKEHRGKPSALNAGMSRATGEIVVFADARQMFATDAVRRLVENFADPTVGAVSGELILTDHSHEEATSEVGLYWRYEKAIRAMESDIHSVVGATGAIYAIRRDLYQDLPDETILDDVLTPMRIVCSGRRVVFEPAAKAYDMVSCCPQAEFGRKVRTLAGNYQLLALMPSLLIPWRTPVFWQFASHKIGRLLAPYFLMAVFVSNVFVLGGIYSWLFAAQAAWYLFAAAGHRVAVKDVVEPRISETRQQKKAA